MGEVKFYYGVMGAGKSTLLAQISHNMHSRGLEVATLKPGIDTKGDDHIISRMGTGHKADMIVSPEANVRETVRAHMGKRGVKLSTLVVDEAQFLTPDQADELVEGAVYDDYDVFAGGLRTNVYKELFPGSKRLFEVAHHCIELTLPNPCRCGEQAVSMVAGLMVSSISTQMAQSILSTGQALTWNTMFSAMNVSTNMSRRHVYCSRH